VNRVKHRHRGKKSSKIGVQKRERSRALARRSQKKGNRQPNGGKGGSAAAEPGGIGLDLKEEGKSDPTK